MTVIDFVPSSQAPFQFQPTLDGSIYNAIVTWNLSGQRYYLNLYSLAGDLIVCEPLIGSPVGIEVQATEWTFGKLLLTARSPHGYKVGRTIFLALVGFTPETFNGTFEVLVVSPNMLQIAMAIDPAPPSVLGSAEFNISMTAGHFNSTLIYREANQQFEISP